MEPRTGSGRAGTRPWRERCGLGRTTGALALLAVVPAAILIAVAEGSEAPGDSHCDAPANEIVAENCRPGSPSSEWDVSGAGDPSIQGFAADISVDQGQTIQFKVDTQAAAWRLDVYRMGWYEGLGARRVATVRPAAGPQNQPACLREAATGLVDCGNWSVSASWDVPADAVSGIYFAKAIREDTGGASHIAFVVRDDDGASDLLFQTMDTTWQAYNQYGGNSLYVGEPAGRAFKVSYNRPFTTRGPTPEDWIFNAEYPMVRFLERNGYDVSYFTGVDTDRRGSELLEHSAFLSVGHDEYWSAAQRQNVEAARDAGVHLAFFSGNEVFWKTRWETSIDGSGTPHRTLVCYKETHANAKIDPLPDVWTGTWRDNRPFNPEGSQAENALTGTIFTVNCCTYDIEVPAEFGRLRFWRNTEIATLGAGEVATLSGNTLGYEWDEDLDNGFRPPGLFRLSSTTVDVPQRILDQGSNYGAGRATHSLTLYRKGSALVFGAGTVQWPWGLDGTHDRGGSTEDLRMQQATVNLFADMGAQPANLMAGLVPATASTDASLPVAAIASPAAGSTVESGVAVTVTGAASDTGGVVAAVEVSTDGGLTWRRAEGRETWSFRWVPQNLGNATLLARAIDDSANLGDPSAAVQVTVGASDGPISVFSEADTPATALANDGQPIETGVKFFSDVDGFVTSIRFYKGAGNLGPHVAHLWSGTGELLAEAPFVGESESGWQQVELGSPVPITANTIYVASYHSASGHYAFTDGYFVNQVDRAPLHMPADGGAAGRNGVYAYGASAFPTNFFQASNYWVDVVFTAETGPDERRPTVLSTSPASGGSGIAVTTDIVATFSEALDAASVTGSSFSLRDDAGVLVEAAVRYEAGARRAILDPNAALLPSTTYTATLSDAIRDLAGNGLAAPVSWSFTTAAPPPPPPDEGPGGPILVISSSTNPFSRYYAEILRTEGLNAFVVRDISQVDAAGLSAFDAAILGEMPLSAAQVQMLADWVGAGGNLVAMKPDPQLAGLLGLTDTPDTLSNGYLRIDTATSPGRGLVGETLQFHGTADRWGLAGARAVALLHSDASTPTGNPAVSLRNVGASGGQAAAFAFDLARSVVYTRQGNPAWIGQERDGTAPIRSNDLFFGGTETDWVDLNKVAIPQADEQQRLLANLILSMTADRKPLPRFWYFPRGEKAVVLLTGDDHGNSGTPGRLDQYLAASPAGCSVDDWECIRGSVYVYTSATFSATQAATYHAAGFEIGLHVNTGCANWTPATLDSTYDSQLAAWTAKYPNLPPPVSNRTHCIAWSDWVGQPRVELDHGIRLDTNYYYWPPGWVANRPGFFTGSGMPMRFADVDGTMVDVFQATTQMTDESGQTYPFTIDTLLDRALGAEAYYGVFTANMHVDSASSQGADAIVASAKARGVPVVSGRQLLAWLDGRNGSSFSGIALAGNVLRFDVAVGAGANGLEGMIPTNGGIAAIRRGGTTVPFTVETVKGVEYARFPAQAGSYEVELGNVGAPAGFVDTTASDFAAGVPEFRTYVAETADGEVMLQPTVGAEFSGTALPAGWAPRTWNTGGAATVTGGSVTVDGASIATEATFAPGHTLEFVGTFGGAPFQNVGLGQTLDTGNEQWALFGHNTTATQLFARINTGNNAVVDTPIPGSFVGSPHRYRIQWNASSVVFSIDGAVVHTANVSLGAQLRPIVSDFNTGGPGVIVDWLRMASFPESGSFLSRIFDAGSPVAWGGLSWTATLPANTSVAMQVRTGDTPTPDGSWSAFRAIASSGAPIGGTSRYLQYAASLTTSDVEVSPVIEEVRIGQSTDTNVPPACADASASTFSGSRISSRVTCTDGDGDGLSHELVAAPSSGVLTFLPDGSFVYEPGAFSGADSFRFRATDGVAFSTEAVFSIQVDPRGFVDTTVAHFSAGTPGNATAVVDPGAVILAPQTLANFEGAALPTGWSDFVWNSGGATTVTAGSVTVNGTRAALEGSFGPGRSLEFVATFGASRLQHVGLGQTLNAGGESWILFSTDQTTNTLFARTNLANAQVNVALPGNLIGTPHRYRIDWGASSVVFSVDGVAVHTQNVAIAASLRPVISEFDAGGAGLSVDWLRMSPYAASGAFASRIFDAGAAVDWGAINWQATVPAQTGLSLEVLTGDTPTPDGSWVSGAVAAGERIGRTSRYLQYRASFTGDGASTPILDEVAIGAGDGVVLPENRPPVCTASSVGTFTGGSLAGSVSCTDPDGDPIVYELVQAPAGNVAFVEDGSFTYEPGPFTGETSLTFRATDSRSLSSAPALLTIRVDAAGFVDTTMAHFSAGTPTGTIVVGEGDGAVILQPAEGSEFDGAALPAGWTTSVWETGGAATVAGGSLQANGVLVGPATLYGPGRVLEFVATFGNTSFQHVGFALDFETAPLSWAMFSTHNVTGRLFARTNDAGQTNDTEIPGSFVGTPHLYRIEWSANQVAYFIDGLHVHTQPVAIEASLRPVISDFGAAAPALAVDWLRMTPFVESGSFSSRIFDAGARVDWGGLSWKANVPAGASLQVIAMAGDTLPPDDDWIATGPLANGAVTGLAGRYLRYVATLGSGSPTTPLLEEVSLGQGLPLAVNQPPVCAGASGSTPEGTTLTGNLGCTDPEGSPLGYAIVGPPANGVVVLQTTTGGFSYSPNDGFSGSDSFTFRATDGEASSEIATFSITVTPVNEAPVAVDDSFATDEGSPLEIGPPGLLGNDTDGDGDTLTVIGAVQPSNGTVQANADGSFTYTPDEFFHGADSFTYQVSDGQVSDEGTVDITVRPVDDAPIASDDTYQVDAGALLDVQAPGVLSNDLELDGQPLTARLLTGPAHGTLELREDGSFAYRSAPGYVGTDSFRYEALDGGIVPVSTGTNAATVFIEVLSANKAPVAVADSYSTPEDRRLIVNEPGVLHNDTDANFDSKTAILVRKPSRGALTFRSDGSISYMPQQNFHGVDTFTYKVSDGYLESAETTVTIEVQSVNDAPVLVDRGYFVNANRTLAVGAPGVLKSAYDGDGDPITAVLVSGPSRGSLTLQPDGSFIYRPSAGYKGPDSFQVRGTDGKAYSDAVTISITVR